ncbi:MAG: tetratricopeptide repeat protein, partial [Blastocatellia bacterium]
MRVKRRADILLEFFGLPSVEDNSQQTQDPIWIVPYRRNRFFAGRDTVINDLRNALVERSRTALVSAQAITGLGGIGKTQTAVEYAYRFRDAYRWVFWLNSESDLSITEDLMSFAKLLCLPGTEASDIAKTLSAVLQWFAVNEGWLLICDNAGDPKLLRNVLPLDPKGHILITSRVQVFHDLAEPVRLALMEPGSAVEFLVNRVENVICPDDEKAAARELAHELGYLPLALEQAGAFIAQTKCQFQNYLTNYRRKKLELLEQSPPIAGDYEHSVATTWSMNFEEVETASPAASDLLKLSAYLEPDRIPLILLSRSKKHLGPHLSAELARADADSLSLDKVLEILTRYSLISRDEDSAAFGIHRLVQEVIRTALPTEEQLAWTERAVDTLADAVPCVEYENWSIYENLEHQAFSASRLVKQAGIESAHAGVLLNQLGLYCDYRGKYVEAEDLLERALSITEKVKGPTHLHVASRASNLAAIYERRGRLDEAEALLRRCVAITETHFGSEHPEMATPLNNLGLIAIVARRYEEAESLIGRALAIRKAHLGPKHPLVATHLNNLAAIYYARGEIDRAEASLRESLGILEEGLVPDHPNTGRCLRNLMVLYYEQRRYKEAQPLGEQALAVLDKSLGPDHPDTVGVRRYLVSITQLLGGSQEGTMADSTTLPAERRSPESITKCTKTVGRDPMMVACPGANGGDTKPVVISIHGIRTQGAWQKELTTVLNEAGFIHEPLNYGFLEAIKILFRSRRTRQVKWFVQEYTRIREEYGNRRLSVIAHSFGTYLVAEAMEHYPEIRFERVILVGSIIPIDYSWRVRLDARQVISVLNECARQDIVVKLAEWVISNAGPSGSRGFEDNAGGLVTERKHPRFGHSDYFYRLNYTNNWIPFLSDGTAPRLPPSPKRSRNWKFLITCTLILAVTATLALVMILRPWKRRPQTGSPRSAELQQPPSSAKDQPSYADRVAPKEAEILGSGEPYSAIKMKDYFDSISFSNPDVTELQRRDFIAQHFGKRVIWNGYVDD